MARTTKKKQTKMDDDIFYVFALKWF